MCLVSQRLRDRLVLDSGGRLREELDSIDVAQRGECRRALMHPGGCDVSLTERVPSQNGRRRRRGELPAEDLAADAEAVGELDAHDGVSGFFQGGERVRRALVGLFLEA